MRSRKPLSRTLANWLIVGMIGLTTCTEQSALAMPDRQTSHRLPIRSPRQALTAPIPMNPDQQALQVADKLRRALAEQKLRRERSLLKVANTAAMQPRLSTVRQSPANSPAWRGLQANGVPRQIRGDVLEPRAAVGGGETDRDRETSRRFLARQRRLMQLEEPGQELQLARYETDELGRRHLRYRQIQGGLPVWPAEVIVHLDPAGNVDAVETDNAPSPRQHSNPQPAVDQRAAATFARRAVEATPQAPTMPPELIYFAAEEGQLVLAWKLELSLSIRKHYLVVVDAANGAILAVQNQVTDANVAGSGLDLLGNTQALNVWQGGNNFYLIDTSKSMFDGSSLPPNSVKGGIVVQDARNKPTGSNPESQPDPPLFQITATSANGPWLPADGVSAAFNLAQTYDYYLERHNRNSIDGNKGALYAMVRYGQNYQNAFWSNPYMVFGTGDVYAAALDVVAHELTHGVTEHTANLVYRGQSGALNEAMSDIFGESVEARTQGHNDWLMGTDLSHSIRSLKNPAQFGDPSTMSQYRALPVTSSGDWGGVHTNSCIISHAYYLLVEGLNGAIGMADAERIFYRALTLHLVPNAQFADMRRAAVLSAEELFGKGSAQATATGLAFDAVEISDTGSTPPPTPTPIPTVNGDDSTLCVYTDPQFGDYLCRRETALGDPVAGVTLSSSPVLKSRPAVSGDGAHAAFVDASNDICLINTDQLQSERCLGLTGQIASVAMSADGLRYAFVLLDAQGNRQNFISVIDANGSGQPTRYTLKAPVAEGGAVTIDYADAMDFSIDGRMIIYDAVNEFPSADGTPIQAWSIYALDLVNEQFLSVVPPTSALDIGNPSVGRAGSGHLTYEKQDPATGDSTVWVADLNAAKHTQVASVGGHLAIPHFSGDDKAVVYSQADSTVSTGASLWRLPLADDLQSASGDPALWMSDADYGVIYRRGAFQGTTQFELISTLVGGGTITSSPAGIDCGFNCAMAFPQDTTVTLTPSPQNGWEFVGWLGCDSVAGSTCSVTMNSNKYPRATFVQAPAIVVTNDGGGLVRGIAGIRCGTRCIKHFAQSRQIKLFAKPQKGWLLDSWTGCDETLVNKCTVQIGAVKRVSAKFRKKIPYQLSLSVAASGTGAGTLKSLPRGINCGTGCAQTWLEGSKVRLIARPDRHSKFAGWAGCPQPRGNRCTVTVDADTSIQASFDAKP